MESQIHVWKTPAPLHPLHHTMVSFMVKHKSHFWRFEAPPHILIRVCDLCSSTSLKCYSQALVLHKLRKLDETKGGGGFTRTPGSVRSPALWGLSCDVIASVSFIIFHRVMRKHIYEFSQILQWGIGWRRAIISDSSQEAKWKFAV